MANQVKRNWHQFNAEGERLGRLASRAAQLLMGKHKAGFVKHLDSGDYVVITNVEKIEVTGNKETSKMYQRYSGYSSGRTEVPLWKVRQVKPEQLLYNAVKGMLPKTKLQSPMLRRLKLVVGEDNPYADKFKNKQ